MNNCTEFKSESYRIALTGVAQWIAYRPANRKVAGSAPGQSPRLGCGPGLRLGAWERPLSPTHPCLSHALMFPFRPLLTPF